VLEDERAGLYVEHKKVAKLGDEEDDAVLVGDLHGDGEIVGSVAGHQDVNGPLGERHRRVALGHLEDVQLAPLGALRHEFQSR